MATTTVTIDCLLNLVPDHPDQVLAHLHAHPDLAAQQDAHGYSLLHAAVAYDHADLLHTLIRTHRVDPNLRDEDGETCLFHAEAVPIARAALRLGVDPRAQNHDRLTAADRLADPDEQPLVAAFLRDLDDAPATDDAGAGAGAPPAPLPPGIQVNVGTLRTDELGGEADPEFRRRIEELAARADFAGAEAQRQLRELVTEAVSGVGSGGDDRQASRRRRVE